MTIDVTKADRDAAARLMALWEDGTLHCDDFVEVIALHRITALDHLTARVAEQAAEIELWKATAASEAGAFEEANQQVRSLTEALAARDKAIAEAVRRADMLLKPSLPLGTTDAARQVSEPLRQFTTTPATNSESGEQA